MDQHSFEPTVKRPCPVCESHEYSRCFAPSTIDSTQLDEFAFASRKLPEYMHLQLHECLQCDTVYASPAFAAGVLATAYREAAYDSTATAGFAAKTYAKFLPSLIARLPNINGALDVGAGDGAFLAELLQHGFRNVVGVEPSLAPVASAAPAVKGLIRPQMFSAGEFSKGDFSLVTCFQTIEHLDAPLSFCKDAFELLQPGGALFLIGHNRRAASARLMGFASPIFDIEHLQLFSPRSLTELLKKASFGDVSVANVVNKYPLFYWARLFPLANWLKNPLVAGLQSAAFRNLKLSLPAGNIAAIGFKPR